MQWYCVWGGGDLQWYCVYCFILYIHAYVHTLVPTHVHIYVYAVYAVNIYSAYYKRLRVISIIFIVNEYIYILPQIKLLIYIYYSGTYEQCNNNILYKLLK